MRKNATIAVPIDVKNSLEIVKISKKWGEFLLEMFSDRQRLKGENAFRELTRLLSKEDPKQCLN